MLRWHSCSDHISTRARLTRCPRDAALLRTSSTLLTLDARWLYLVFFNGLWVVFPVWILYEAYKAMSSAMSQAEMVDLVNYLKKDE
jgi:hypothetical protein